MRARTFYTVAILLPAAALVITLALATRPERPELPLPAGATEMWRYPRFAVRELAAYGLVAAWLLWELHRRTVPDFARLVWWAPVALVAIIVILLVPFVLGHGALREMLANDGARIALRLIVRLAIGYAYLGLTEFVRKNLLEVESAGAV
jgi:branched-subunit amino acid ABC-type transport system permease component